MTDLQYDATLRDAQNNALLPAIGPGASVAIFDGDKPSSCADPITSQRLIAAGRLPDVWLSSSAGGTVTKAGQWMLVGQAAAGSGARGTFFRVIDAAGACRMQASFGDESGAASMRTKANRIVAGQELEITSFALVRGNA